MDALGAIERALAIVLALGLCYACAGQTPANGTLKLGGFRCIDLRPYNDDNYLDLYQTGFWSNASFRMDVWKRLGVPYWFPEGAGNIRVAGPAWTRPGNDVVSATVAGAQARADAQQPGNGAVRFANDGDPFSYWYAGDNHPSGKLEIDFGKPQRVKEVRFLGWATPRHAPRDYSIGLILPDRTRKELAAKKGEKRMGEWIAFPVDNVLASGVYLDVTATMENEHGPVIYELQARGDEQKGGKQYRKEVVVPLRGLAAKEVWFLGNVGDGFDTAPDKETPIGEYVFTYGNGKKERVPLIAGRNVASTHYGNFVPEAQFAWGLRDRDAVMEPGAKKLSYHLDELVEVEPKRQLMVFSHKPAHPDWPLKQVAFRCTDPNSYLILQGITLLQKGEKMNALFYGGRRLDPTPKSAPPAGPSWRPESEALPLDGRWRFATDPGNKGIRHKWFAPDYDDKAWMTMPVPSQWYVQGVDFHGVAWYRRTFTVPKSFPGKVLELDFQRVDYDARVWINGTYVGRHVGAYSSFKLDATKAVKKGAKNVVVVRVDSPIDPGFAGYKTLAKGNAMDDIAMPYAQEGSMGGIYRSVALTGRGDAAVGDVWASSEIAPDLGTAKVTVRLTVSSAGGGPLEVKCLLSEPGNQDWRHLTGAIGGPATGRSFVAVQKPAAKKKQALSFTFDVTKPKLWWPWEQGSPNLHVLSIEVWRGNKLLDRHLSRVGIKQVEHNSKENCLYVNHHRIFLKGGLNDDCHWQSLMDRRAYRYRIQMQKDANLNVIRLTTHESSPEFYELCDEMGMMVWQEMPLQWSYSSSPGIRADITRIVGETVTQTRPHASVIGYSAWNEGGQFGFTDEITKLIASLDPTRPMTRASGGGDWDVHVYPTQWRGLTRRTPLWSGLTFGFISETGAYGISDVKNLKEMFGEDLFQYDGAEYFWETFASYRHIDGPAYMESPSPIEWPTPKIKDYVLKRVDASERFFWQAMKSMYEVTRAQRFAPTTSCIYCRFDDPFPTAFLGLVNFVGRPLKAYYGVKEACQPVLPILMLDPLGASDVRVVNEYWFKSWVGCRLHFELRTQGGDLVRELDKKFDLPADSTVTVLSRGEIGDLWGVPGGIKAVLTVTGPDGALLSENRYDFTAEEVHTLTTCLYPAAPAEPVFASLALPVERTQPAKDAYGGAVCMLGGDVRSVSLTVNVPAAGEYTIRPACDSGAVAHRYELLLDGVIVPLESYLWLSMDEAICRQTWSEHGLTWFPGWVAKTTKGRHTLELRWPAAEPAPKLVLNALAMQPK
jgi:beta-mannosidase